MFDAKLIFRKPKTTAWLMVVSDWRAETPGGDFLGVIEIADTEIEARQALERSSICDMSWKYGRATSSLVEIVNKRRPVEEPPCFVFARLADGVFATPSEAAAERLALMRCVDRLKTVSNAVFGEEWLGPLARELNVDECVVQSWIDEEVEIPPHIDWLVIRQVRLACCRRLDRDLRRRADAIDAFGRGNLEFVDDDELESQTCSGAYA